MAELNDPFGGSTQTLINDADAAFTALVNRVVAWQNLEVTETRNAATRLARITELEAEIVTKNTRITELENEVESLQNVRKAWWPVLQTELAKPVYAQLVTAKNAQGVFDSLNVKAIPQQLNPIPIEEVRAAISGVLAQLRLDQTIPDEKKALWKDLLLEQIQVMGNAVEVRSSIVQGLVNAAIQAEIVPTGFTIGTKLISKLEQLGLVGRLNTPIDIVEAMGW